MTRSAIRSTRLERRLAEQANTPAPVTIRLCCGICSGEHRTDEHDTIGMRGLDPDGLRTLRHNVSDELLRAVRADAGHDTIEGMLRLLDALDRRISKLTEEPDSEPRAEANSSPTVVLLPDMVAADATGAMPARLCREIADVPAHQDGAR